MLGRDGGVAMFVDLAEEVKVVEEAVVEEVEGEDEGEVVEELLVVVEEEGDKEARLSV